MKKIKNLQEALEIFQNAAGDQAGATEQGDYKTANKSYHKIVEVIEFLKNEKAIDNLLNFLNNPSIGVRLWAASYLLHTHQKESIKVLEEIVKEKSIHSLTAETTLDEWAQGNVEF